MQIVLPGYCFNYLLIILLAIFKAFQQKLPVGEILRLLVNSGFKCFMLTMDHSQCSLITDYLEFEILYSVLGTAQVCEFRTTVTVLIKSTLVSEFNFVVFSQWQVIRCLAYWASCELRSLRISRGENEFHLPFLLPHPLSLS